MDNQLYKLRLRRAITAGKNRAKTYQRVTAAMLSLAATSDDDDFIKPSKEEYCEPINEALINIATIRLALSTVCKEHAVDEKELIAACREVVLEV